MGNARLKTATQKYMEKLKKEERKKIQEVEKTLEKLKVVYLKSEDK